MKTRKQLAIVLISLVTPASIRCFPKKETAEITKAEVTQGTSYEDLVSLFKE